MEVPGSALLNGSFHRIIEKCSCGDLWRHLAQHWPLSQTVEDSEEALRGSQAFSVLSKGTV